jgi:hypothetical protein
MSIGLGIAISPSFEATHIPGVSALFSYPKNSYNQGEADPTPTITGTPGGTFSASAGIVFVDSGSNIGSSTGQIDLSASTILSHTITYTVSGISSNFGLAVTAAPYASTSSFSFDGVNDYFDLGTEPIVTGIFSISMWIKRNSTTVGDFTQVLIGKDNQSSARVFNIFFKNITGQISFWVSSTGTYSGTYRVDTSTAINEYLNKGDGQSNEIYVDGAEASYTSQGQGRSTLFNTTAIKTSIGGDALTGTTFNFNGKMDEVSIWNTALSSDAITEIAAGPNDLTSLTNASSSNLKAWYKM